MPTLPTFDHIVFDEPSHTYTANEKPLQAVSRLIKELQTPFDADYWATKKAADRGITKDEILAEWAAKATRGKQRGTRVHAHIQRKFGQVDDMDPRLVQSLLPEEKAFDEWLTHVRRITLLAATPLCMEYIIGDEELGIAGTADAVFPDPTNDAVYLYDWKTGSFETANRFRKTLLPPFDDLADCELNYYSLQTSLYQLILQRAGLTTLSDRAYIVHLSAEGTYTTHRTLDLRTRLEAWLKARSAAHRLMA